MELSEFVELSLTQVLEGVAKAQRAAEAFNSIVHPTPVDAYGGTSRQFTTVKLDIAVSSHEGKAGAAKGGIRVMGIGVGGELADHSGTSTVTRIQFEVPVLLPVSDEQYNSLKVAETKAIG